MKDLWIGSFVHVAPRAIRPHPLAGKRAQVVAVGGCMIILRYADGTHHESMASAVTMDADQTTPVWPPPLTRMDNWAPKLGDFVNVERPDIGTTRGVIVGQTITNDDHWCAVQCADAVGEVRRDLITLSTDQTTPIKVADEPE